MDQINELLFQTLFNNLPEPRIVLHADHPDYTIVAVNEAFRLVSRIGDRDILGKSMWQIHDDVDNHNSESSNRVRNALMSAIEKKGPVKLDPIRYDLTGTVGGTDFSWWQAEYTPILGDDNNVKYLICATHDITARMIAEAAAEKIKSQEKELLLTLKDTQDTLQLAIEGSGMGTWRVDIATDELIVSETTRMMHGLPYGLNITLNNALELINPEHRERVRQGIYAAINNHTSFIDEYLINPMNGSEPRWLRSGGKAYYGPDGNSIYIAGTIFDITAQKQAEQRKDDFISIASHELKTPITTLKASLQMLNKMKENLGSPVVPKLIEQANKSMEKTSGLVEDLLNATRMAEGQLPLNKKHFKIGDILHNCCSHVRMAGKHEIIVQGNADLLVYADEHRIDQVIVNMVNNAVKYAPDSREIYLIVTPLVNMVKVSVKDAGPGITSEKIAHLFDRYYRSDYSGMQFSGLGLGLYISSEIVKKHGGEIGVNSEAGKGSTFWFTIPVN
eukprot:gene10587-10657_t